MIKILDWWKIIWSGEILTVVCPIVMCWFFYFANTELEKHVLVIWTDTEPESIGHWMFLSVLRTGPKYFKNSVDIVCRVGFYVTFESTDPCSACILHIHCLIHCVLSSHVETAELTLSRRNLSSWFMESVADKSNNSQSSVTRIRTWWRILNKKNIRDNRIPLTTQTHEVWNLILVH